jgi:hypothetical protein
VQRLSPIDAIALGLACAAAALALASHGDPLVPAIAAGVALGGLVRAQTAQQIVIWLVAPLLAVIGRSDPTFLAACACLEAAAILWAVAAHRAPGSSGEIASATRIVLAFAAVVLAAALLAFALIFS